MALALLLAASIYIVQAGDCLCNIALAHGTTWQHLAAVNGLQHPELIHPGQIVHLDQDVQSARGELKLSSNFDAVDFALAQVGKPYCWGGTGPNCYDCSGLVWAAYRSQGMMLPRTVWFQEHLAKMVGKPQRGDLVFFSFRSRFDHVGLVISPGKMVHATRSYGRVLAQRIDYWCCLAAYGRPF